MDQRATSFNNSHPISQRNTLHFSGTALQTPPAAFLERKDIPNLKPADVLLVIPHSDDESLFFGFIPNLLAEGKTLQLVYATDSAAGTDSESERHAKKMMRRQELKNALEILGVTTPPLMLDYLIMN